MIESGVHKKGASNVTGLKIRAFKQDFYVDDKEKGNNTLNLDLKEKLDEDVARSEIGAATEEEVYDEARSD
ncbi:hypothetical protein QYF36_001745 [Acer negundo]|nr:hypothetical protein QYF36_001745 [Acer negundo]